MVSVDVFGCCVSMDIFRFTGKNEYKVNQVIERNSISTLFTDKIDISGKIDSEILKGILPNNFERRCLNIALEKSACEILKKGVSDYLIMDLGEERLDKYRVLLNENEYTDIDKTSNSTKLIEELKQYFKVKEIRLDDRPWETIRESYIKFSNLIKSKSKYKKIIVIELYMANEYVTGEGELKKFSSAYEISQRNEFLRKIYELFYEQFPECIKIKIPGFVYGNLNHMWGGHPLHYKDTIYRYLGESLGIALGEKRTSTLDKLRAEQTLENRLYTRVLNSRKAVLNTREIVSIPILRKEIEELKKIVEMQDKKIELLKTRMR